MVLRAYIDESAREGPGGFCYVVAAAVAVGDEEHARDELRKMLLPGQNHLHWRDESSGRRAEIVERLSVLDIHAFASYRYPTTAKSQERARRQCLVRLADDLAVEHVEVMVIESRRDVQDRRDRQVLVESSRGRTATIEYHHVGKRAEPLLWAADAIAGALSLHLAEITSAYFDALQPSLLHVRRIEP